MHTARFTDSPKNRISKAAGAGLVMMAAMTLAAVGCGNKNASPEESSSSSSGTGSVKVTADARAKAQDMFTTRCAACHGLTGKGDGPGAANLTPKPPNFQDKTWQASITDQNIENAILYGGAAIGKSPMMPANPDLQSQPAVVAALREKIRQLGK